MAKRRKKMIMAIAVIVLAVLLYSSGLFQTTLPDKEVSVRQYETCKLTEASTITRSMACLTDYDYCIFRIRCFQDIEHEGCLNNYDGLTGSYTSYSDNIPAEPGETSTWTQPIYLSCYILVSDMDRLEECSDGSWQYDCSATTTTTVPGTTTTMPTTTTTLPPGETNKGMLALLVIVVIVATMLGVWWKLR